MEKDVKKGVNFFLLTFSLTERPTDRLWNNVIKQIDTKTK